VARGHFSFLHAGSCPDLGLVDMVSSRRNKFEIAADILRMEKGSRTKILHTSNLSFRQLDWYLRQLSVHGYLTIGHEGKRTVYCTTERGKKLMEQIDRVMDMLAKPKGVRESPLVESKIGLGDSRIPEPKPK